MGDLVAAEMGRSGWIGRLMIGGMVAFMLAGCATGTSHTTAQIGNQTLNVARSALAGGNPQMALTVTNAVLKSSPDDAEALIDRGDAYYLLKNCAQASADYQHALRLAPHAAMAELGVGRCAMAQNPRIAAAAFARATRDAPGNAEAFNDLGIAQASESEFAAAAVSLRQALALDPSLQAARVNLGLALALGGDPAAGETMLGPLVRGPDASPMIRANYATALTLAGHPTAAAKILLVDMPETEAEAMVSQLQSFGHAAQGAVAVGGKS
jgi:Flp pilus assembly protein TadD